MDALELAQHHTTWRVDKYHEDIADWVGREEEFYRRFKPYESLEYDGNLYVNAGIALTLDLLIGAGGTVFSNANAHIGVGDSSTAASAGQTNLQAATNKFRKAMEATFPSRSAQTLTFKSSYGSGEANFAWEEWAIFNDSTAGTMLNRKVQSFGTKAGGTWVLTATFTLS